MIDFRYHIVSIVAVLLALSAGVVLGSGLIGGPLLDDIQRRADDIRSTNDELRQLAEDRLARLESQDDFARSAEAYLVPGSLSGVKVTIIEVAGTAEGLTETVRTTVGAAGGEVAGTVRLLDDLQLDGEIKVDELALALGSVSGDPDDLRLQAATLLGSRLAAAATVGENGPGDQAAARGRLEELITDMSDPGFIEVEQTSEGPVVPTDAVFLVLGGAQEEPRYEISPMVVRMVEELGRRGRTVVVAEAEGSTWEVISGVREDSDVAEAVGSVTGADTAFGRVALALTIARAVDGDVGHHGVGADSGAVLPSPEPSAVPTE